MTVRITLQKRQVAYTSCALYFHMILRVTPKYPVLSTFWKYRDGKCVCDVLKILLMYTSVQLLLTLGQQPTYTVPCYVIYPFPSNK